MSLHYAINCCEVTAARINHHPALRFRGPCVVTGKTQEVTILSSELEAYDNGALIQDAFKRLSVGEREFLQSGHSKEGWDITFPPGEQGEFVDCECLDADGKPNDNCPKCSGIGVREA